ncbi:hypothetical protein GCM10027516_19320 [Niabella aquatica]
MIAQNTISGTVNTTNGVLPYANIGIKGKNFGTISNKQGAFEIDIPDKFLYDSLTFSYSGFRDVTLRVKDIISSKQYSFFLNADTITLEPVVISNKTPALKTIGVKSYSSFLFSPPVNSKNNDIVEFAQYIANTKSSQILSTSIMIRNGSGDSVTLRINFYNIKDGAPFEKICPVNIIERVSTQKGWQKIDLQDHDLHFKGPFFITYELIPGEREITFNYGSRLGGSIYIRHNSLGSWEKVKGGSLSAYVTVKQ